jgi:hypothetical protein
VPGPGGGGGADRVHPELLGQLVQLLQCRRLLGGYLVQKVEDLPAVPAGADSIRRYPIATIRSIGIRARSAISRGTVTSNFISRSASRSFGRVIIFMYLQ